MERILVGVDGSAASDAALLWAGHISERTGARIVALHAFELPFIEVPPWEHEVLVAERTAVLEGDWVRHVRDAGVPVDTMLEDGDPRQVVTVVADSSQADLVVLGRSGRGGGPGFAHLGSVVEHVAHHVRRPLAVVPSTAVAPIHRIVIGVDGSDGSMAAIEWCADLAGTIEADVFAVEVDEPILEWTASWEDRNWRRTTEQDLEKWIAPIAARGVTTEVLATRNLHPADGLLGIASARRADLLVIGARGAGGFTGLRFGGVAMKVLHKSTLPLVLVPPSDRH